MFIVGYDRAGPFVLAIFGNGIGRFMVLIGWAVCAHVHAFQK